MCFAVGLGSATLSLLGVYPGAVMGVLLGFSGLELALAGARPLRADASEDDLAVALITAGVTLTLKTGLGCAIGLLAAALCGGYGRLVELVRRGELRAAVLKGVVANAGPRHEQAIVPPGAQRSDSPDA